MATLSRAESKHMYSWWWNSHISPKNSKWLQENLTDMDSKVKNMIKLIEVDEDSFARRAEMYYKKRPELMKLVEEFYRAYRALAERYDHATGVIRHAHRTMAEVFPDQVQGMGSDENDSEPRTPEMSMSARPSCDPDELPKGAIGLSRSDKVIRNRDAAFTHESETTAGQSGESPISDNLGQTRARRSLNFHNSEKNDSMAESERMGRYETDVMALKEALSKLEAEKEAGLLQFQQSLQKLSDLEAELKGAQDDSKSLFERAVNAEAQVQTLKESLAKLEGEREANLHQYQKCVEKISGLEANFTHVQEDVERQDKRVCQSEQEAQVLREELSHLRSEKESSLAKYMEALEKIANLGNQLLLAEDKAEATNKRADKAEKEVEALTKDVESLSKDNKALAIEYEQCLSKIASLEAEIALVKEEAERLKHERDEGAAKLKGAEEQCHVLERSNMSMQSELDTLSHKVGMQNEELSEKQRELGRLWTCVQEERLRFVEVEIAFQTLQGLHSQNQEELRSVASELQKRVQLLKEMEIQNQSLQDEVQKVRDENTGLNLSSAASIKNLQDEISNLQTGKCQLEGELEHRLDQRNALQQEIYCLKEELKELNKKHHAVMEQVESVGFLPECISSSIRDLREENSSLKENCQSSEAEISALLEKLTSMEKLVESNALLEKSLSELGSELENARAKVKALEESCQLLVDEKSSAVAEKATLISQLELTTENLEKLSERNTLLENSLFDANAELEALRTSSKKLEESCLLLGDEKSVLVSEKQVLEMKLESAQKQLEDLGTRHKELEQNYSGMKDKRESALILLEELRTSLATEKQERSTASQLTGQQIAKMENQIRSLEKVGKKTREELEGELDNAMNAQLEIFILQNSLHDMREKNSALLLKCEKILETSKLSEKLISELEYENIEQQDEVNFLSDQIKRLRMGMVQLLKALEVDLDCAYDEKHLDDDQLLLHRILVKLDDTKSSLYKAWDENQKLVIEKSVLITLLGQLKQEVADLKTLIITVQQEFRIGNDQLSSLQSDMKRLLQSNEELILSVREGNQKENLLAAEVESLRAKVLQIQGVCKDLETENGRVQEEKKSLTKQVLYLDEEKNKLELENSNLVVEAVSMGNLSVILQSTTEQSWAVIDQLHNDIDRLWSHNWALEEKVKIVENKLDEAHMEKSSLERSLKTCEHELVEVTVANSQLKEELSLKEMELLQVESVKDDEQKQKLHLSEKYNLQLKERELIQQSMNDLDAELIRTKEEQEDARKRVEMLGFELQKGKDEAELWETAAGTFFIELQATAVREALVSEKLSELSREYVSLQDENSRVQAQLAGYIPALACITDSVASLENHAAPTQFELIDGQEKKGAGSGQGPNEDDVFTANGFSELNNVAMRIKAIESSVIEMKKLSDEKNSQTSSKLDVATREIETLRSQQLSRSHRGGSSRSSRRYSPEIIEVESSQNGHINHQQKQAPRTDSFETSGGGDMMMMKDIVLDQVSSATSSHGRNMKCDDDRDDQNLELWETMDQGGGSINLRVGRTSHYKAASTPSQNQQLFDAVKEHHKNRPPSSESLGGKEIISVDKMDISSRFPEFLEPETKKKVLERLASDIQKLTNLQITVQDLKEKVVTTENNSNLKGNKGGVVEYVGVKEQLGEAQSTISKLLETNEKLVKKVESSSLHTSSYSDVSSTSSMMDMTSEIGASSRRRGRVSEQARRCSEKIGRLQLEVQKIQFLLLKLDGAGSNRTSAGRGGGTRVGERNTRVVLRDYLYGGPRTPRRRMKSRFCGCVRPPTSGGD